MLTQSDLQKIKILLKQTNTPTEKFVDAQHIQKSLKKLATKEDIKNFATKNELKNMAKEVVNLIGAFDKSLKIDIATVKTEIGEEIQSVKTELKGEIHSLDKEIQSVKTELKGDISGLDSEIQSVKTELNEKMDVMIAQMSKVEKNTNIIPSLKEKINNHEERIRKLEIKNPLAF